MDHYALLIWQIAVIRKARNQKLSTQYKKGIISEDWLRDLVKLSRFDKGPLLAKEFLADSGIRLVIEKHFKKTYLDGAAMLDGDSPIVALTLRHDRIDNFWFALTHELIHVQRHLDPDKQFIFDNLDDKTRVSKEELEADELAKNALIPLEEWNASEVKYEPTVKNLKALAEKLRIHHAIVAGRVRHEQNNWRIFTGILGKDDVSRCFESQSEGFGPTTNLKNLS
jgi:HTH-type transcriptional regulator/antitoxin HigA